MRKAVIVNSASALLSSILRLPTTVTLELTSFLIVHDKFVDIRKIRISLSTALCSFVLRE